LLPAFGAPSASGARDTAARLLSRLGIGCIGISSCALSSFAEADAGSDALPIYPVARCEIIDYLTAAPLSTGSVCVRKEPVGAFFGAQSSVNFRARRGYPAVLMQGGGSARHERGAIAITSKRGPK
jgi:hypothetical protein